MARVPSPLLLAPLAGSVLVYSQLGYVKNLVHAATGAPHAYAGYAIVSALAALVAFAVAAEFKTTFLFVWHCFIVPLGNTTDQKSRLDKFYQGQAQVYDKTRAGLLRGRNTMLAMSAAHLRAQRDKDPNRRLVWVDVGGGTGWNVEAMDKHFPIADFDAVYVVDLCAPLLDLAQKRFEARGWKNVHCLCQNALTFTLPEWSDGAQAKGSLGFISLSYSLSMIPSYHTLLDRLDYLLTPDTGIISVADFYTSGKTPSPHEKAIGGSSKRCGWLSRWFWQIWFDFDHVDLSPGRRDYLEYRFGTVKSYNGRNQFVLPFIVRIPYYIWIGCSRQRDTTRFAHAFEVDGGNLVGNCSPVNGPTVYPASASATASITEVDGADLDLGESAMQVLAPSGDAIAHNVAVAGASEPAVSSAVRKNKLVVKKRTDATIIDITPPLSSFHYQLNFPWRLPYFESPVHAEFRTFIYSFTWEDPEEDMRHLQLSPNDSVFAITSAGDNVLHYAINARVGRIHSVDMNPCQGHLLELKLAAIKALDFKTFFAMFGEGKVANFRWILDHQLSPYLSSEAYQFWRYNAKAFQSNFYLRGYAGWALRIASWLVAVSGKSEAVRQICEAETIEAQAEIWEKSLRGLFVEGGTVQRLIDSPIFLWNALGVPKNQKAMFERECSVYEFIRDTLDPIGKHALLSKGAYHYLLCLLGHYTPESCPDYLTQRGFEALKADDGALLDAFRLHTDSIVNVLKGLGEGAITRAIIMDHLDWFNPGSEDVEEEVAQFKRALPKGGMVFWRSAAKYPWYNDVFERHGFHLTPLGMRDGPRKAIDRVNMYASFWRAVKV